MAKWFSFFGRYRTLAAELDDALRRCTAAEDDARFWRAKAEVWESETKKAQEEMLISHRALIDWTAMRLTGFAIFGTAPPLPRGPMPAEQPVERPVGKRLARDVVNELAGMYDKELADYNASKAQ